MPPESTPSKPTIANVYELLTEQAAKLDALLAKVDVLTSTLERWQPFLDRYEKASQAGSAFKAYRQMRKDKDQ